MKLTHKNFLYTAIVTIILTVLVIGYFVFMLPSLYVEYMSNKNLDEIKKQHQAYLSDGSYENIQVSNPSCVTFEIPFEGDSIIVTGKAFKTTIEPTTDEMSALIFDVKSFIKENIRSYIENNVDFDSSKLNDEFENKFSEWKKVFFEQMYVLDELPLELDTNLFSDASDSYFDKSSEILYYSSDTIIFKAGVSDTENFYSNYIAVTYSDDRIVMSVLPAMTPHMNEITPIVIQSLPVLMAVIILFALVVSNLYSKGIVNPIIELSIQAKNRKKIKIKGNDEISMLVKAFNDLYDELDINYRELENKNKRQEAFLRASSHQLKTPISAALLLTDGMINKIGKYQDAETYLPEVKKQIFSMRKIVEDILSLSRHESNLTKEKFDINIIVENTLNLHKIALSENRHIITTEYAKSCIIESDSLLLTKIIDNLISNAIVHSGQGSIIKISTQNGVFEIFNDKAHIDEEILPNIFEPFVSEGGSGNGLGLYIVAYYAELLGIKIEICNYENGVLTRLTY